MGQRIDLAATMRQAQRDGLIGGGSTFKLEEGANRVRVVQGFLPHQGEFKGERTFKWLTRVLDRRDGKVKAFFMGHTVYKQLVAFQQDTESGTNFDELPMPYDININATGAGTMEAKYTVVPSQKRVPLTADEEAAVAKEDSLEDLKVALRAKKSDPTPAPTEPHPFDPDEMPFESETVGTPAASGPVEGVTKQAIGAALQAASQKEKPDALKARLLAELGRLRYESYTDFIDHGSKDAARILKFLSPQAFSDGSDIPV